MTTGIGLFFIKEIDDPFKHTTLIYTEPFQRYLPQATLVLYLFFVMACGCCYFGPCIQLFDQ
jgi:hypothetical protein